MTKNRVIGQNNHLPWHLPKDLQRFKALTTGHPIIMGRKTYESIGKPLPNRTNIILTRDQDFTASGCLIANSIKQAMHYAGEVDSEVFIIGGADIYQQFLPQITRLYLTIVETELTGDAYFPVFDAAKWQEVFREPHLADEKHAYPFQFLVLEKKQAKEN